MPSYRPAQQPIKYIVNEKLYITYIARLDFIARSLEITPSWVSSSNLSVESELSDWLSFNLSVESELSDWLSINLSVESELSDWLSINLSVESELSDWLSINLSVESELSDWLSISQWRASSAIGSRSIHIDSRS